MTWSHSTRMCDALTSADHNGHDTADRDGEHPEMEQLRVALGAVPVAPPASYRVSTTDGEVWQVRQDGEKAVNHYLSRQEALRAARLAVVRCAAYRLFLQDEAGRTICESYNWPASAPDA